MKTFLLIVILLGVSTSPALAKSYTDKEAILSIIGEAESEGLEGMTAIGEAIRTRGTLKGVYGLKSKRVLKGLYSPATYKLASKAWTLSKTSHLTRGASGWGNKADLVKFNQTIWFKKCVITVKIGNHFFYKMKGA